MQLIPNDMESTASLVIAFANLDPKLAEKYESRLPPLPADASINAEQLENLALPTSSVSVASQQNQVKAVGKQE